MHLLCNMGLSQLIYSVHLNGSMHTHGTNFSGQRDGEKLIDTKVGDVHSTDSRQQPSQLCLYCVMWALACRLCSKFLISERIDAHT